MQRRSVMLSAIASLIVSGTSPVAWAQDKWPTKPVTYPAGGTTDILGRLIGQKLGPVLGTTIVVDNRGGASGSVASEITARAPADGYALLGGTVSSHATNVSLYPKLGYDPIRFFSPVALIGINPLVLIVGKNSPYKTLQDVLAAAKAKPRTISSASAGNGTSQHLALEWLGYKSGTQFIHVPYKGSGPAIQVVFGDQVDMMFDTTVVARPHIQSGKVRALAVISSRRLGSLPSVPTVAESGVRGFEVLSRQAVFAPAGTPKPIIDRLHAEIVKILQLPEMQERLKTLGLQPSAMTIDQIAAFQTAEVDKWAKVVKAANIRLE